MSWLTEWGICTLTMGSMTIRGSWTSAAAIVYRFQSLYSPLSELGSVPGTLQGLTGLQSLLGRPLVPLILRFLLLGLRRYHFSSLSNVKTYIVEPFKDQDNNSFFKNYRLLVCVYLQIHMCFCMHIQCFREYLSGLSSYYLWGLRIELGVYAFTY